MGVAVVIPFAGDDDARMRALEYVCSRYETVHPNWQVAVGYGDVSAWSKAAAVEDALRKTEAELLVVADADVWADGLAESVNAVEVGVPWAIPHSRVHRLDAASTERFFDGEREGMRYERAPYWGVAGGGIVVLARELYDRVPLDPRFVGWGGEDWSWGYALRTLAGDPDRLRSPLWHFVHPPQVERPSIGSARNKALRRKYADALRHPALMHDLVKEVTCPVQ